MMGGLGLVIGLVLAVAAKAFYVYVDPQVEAVASALHGANCGGCGKPGCGANAEAIVAGQASPNSCVAAGPEVAEAIAALLCVAVTAMEPNIARPGCYPAGSAASRFGRRHLRRRQAGAGFRQALPGSRGPDGNDPFQRALGQEPAGGRGRRRRRVRRPEHSPRGGHSETLRRSRAADRRRGGGKRQEPGRPAGRPDLDPVRRPLPGNDFCSIRRSVAAGGGCTRRTSGMGRYFALQTALVP